jgi:hypothetical protein
MCNYVEYKIIYKDYEKSPKHVTWRRDHDRCDEAKQTGYVCADAQPALGLNGKPIQFAATSQQGKCPKCLS